VSHPEVTDSLFEKGRAFSADRQDPAHGGKKRAQQKNAPSGRGPTPTSETTLADQPKDVELTTAEILDFSRGADS